MATITQEQLNQIIQNKPENVSVSQLTEGLKKRGHTIEGEGKINFMERLKAGFGNDEAQAQGRALEEQAGLRGKFDIGDIADVAGQVPGLVGFGVGATLGAPLGGVGAVGGGAVGAGLGETVRQGIGGALGVQDKPDFGSIAKETALGGAVGGVGKGLGLLGKLVRPTAKIGSKTGKLVGEATVGTERAEALKVAKDNPFFKTFRTGEKTIDDVAQQTRQAGGTFQTKSINKFQNALQTAEGSVNRNQTIKSINTIIREELDLGGKGALKSALKGTKLTDQEANQISKVISVIKKHKDWSVQGVQQLKQKVNGFYRKTGDYANSNNIITKIAGKDGVFNTITTEANPKLKSALGTASKEIELLNKLKINVIGKNQLNVELTPNRLKALAKGLSDPNTKQATKKLIQELEKNLPPSQRNLLQQLEAFNANEILGQKVLGFEAPFQTATKLVGRGLGRGAEAVGQAQRNLPSMNIPTRGIGTASKLGLFEALRQKR